MLDHFNILDHLNPESIFNVNKLKYMTRNKFRNSVFAQNSQIYHLGKGSKKMWKIHIWVGGWFRSETNYTKKKQKKHAFKIHYRLF